MIVSICISRSPVNKFGGEGTETEMTQTTCPMAVSKATFEEKILMLKKRERV